MGILIVVVLAVLVVGGVVAGYVAARRPRDRGGYLEPPPSPPPTAPPQPLDLDEVDLNEPSSGVAVVVPDEPDPATVAEIEEVLEQAADEVAQEAVKPRFR